MNRFLRLILIIFSIPCANHFYAQHEPELAGTIKKYVEAEAQYDLFSGAVLVSMNNTIIYQQAFGYADKENKIPNTIDTKFSVGSVGKTFTGVLIMQLVEQGKIRLTDKLEKYLPDFPYREKSKIQKGR